MRRAKMLLVALAVLGWIAWMHSTATAPIEGDIEPIELNPPEGDWFMGIPVPDCWHLYNNGNHREWAECMGVGYK